MAENSRKRQVRSVDAVAKFAIQPIKGEEGRVRVFGVLPELCGLSERPAFIQLHGGRIKGRSFIRFRGMGRITDYHSELPILQLDKVNAKKENKKVVPGDLRWERWLSEDDPFVVALRHSLGADYIGVTEFEARVYPNNSSICLYHPGYSNLSPYNPRETKVYEENVSSAEPVLPIDEPAIPLEPTPADAKADTLANAVSALEDSLLRMRALGCTPVMIEAQVKSALSEIGD